MSQSQPSRQPTIAAARLFARWIEFNIFLEFDRRWKHSYEWAQGGIYYGQQSRARNRAPIKRFRFQLDSSLTSPAQALPNLLYIIVLSNFKVSIYTHTTPSPLTLILR